MKIFGIGLTRTGTLSLTNAMDLLGYKVKHAPKSVDEAEEYDFLSDYFVATRYKFFDYIYPDAKFIITLRDLSSWLKSNREYFNKKNMIQSIDNSILAKENKFNMYGTIEFDEKLYESAYFTHLNNVNNHFKGREGKLLYINICSGQGWEKLCKFLSKPIPDIAFPYTNRRMKFNKERNCWE